MTPEDRVRLAASWMLDDDHRDTIIGVSAELTDAERRKMTAAAGQCVCGRALYEHSRHKVPNAGIDEYVCGRNESGKFRSATLPAYEYDINKGLVIHG